MREIIKRYGYKLVALFVVVLFSLSLFTRYENSEPTVWCYECNKYVLASSNGHQTEPPSEK